MPNNYIKRKMFLFIINNEREFTVKLKFIV